MVAWNDRCSDRLWPAFCDRNFEFSRCCAISHRLPCLRPSICWRKRLQAFCCCPSLSGCDLFCDTDVLCTFLLSLLLPKLAFLTYPGGYDYGSLPQGYYWHGLGQNTKPPSCFCRYYIKQPACLLHLLDHSIPCHVPAPDRNPPSVCHQGSLHDCRTLRRIWVGCSYEWCVFENLHTKSLN